MITRGQLRPRGSYSTTRPRGTTPQPRQRLQVYREEDGSTHNDFFLNATKVEEIDDIDPLTGQQYLVEEAAREDDINYDTNNVDVNGFNKLLHYCLSEDYVMTGKEDPYKGHYTLFNDMSKI
eukprot:1429938-Amphidinium_carterae.1